MAEAERIPRVLVVDDEPNIRELVQVALKFHGCTVSTASNGTDAIRQAEATTPDLIVLDVMLPDISTASRSADACVPAETRCRSSS
jgi:two-component system OmpR family response regulator